MKNIKTSSFFVALIIVGFSLLSCAVAERARPLEAPVKIPSADLSQTKEKAAWSEQNIGLRKAEEVEWEKALEAARKEGRVSSYSTISAEVRTAISKAFKERYGIEIEWVAGKMGELSQKLLRERRSGIYWADLATGGTGTPLNVLKPAGVLDLIEPELILPEVKDPKVWYEGKLPFFDKDKMIFSFRADATHTILINKNLARKEEIKSYRDLLNPRWKGKIVWYDPTIGGSGNQFFSVVGEIIMGYDFMRQLARQEPMFTRDKRQLVEWVARGKYAIGIGAEDASIKEFERAGFTLLAQFTPVEGSYMTTGSGNVHIYNKPSHPNARKIFLNWLLSREGQTLWSRVGDVQSARLDVPTEHLSSGKLRDPAKKYFMADTEEWESKKEERFELAREIFGHLLR